ncbi:hypothetical protein R1flu_028603 [Riccia fluitans]|uniref:Uncharacterized protein n=1 Tax=Riccia fluitans TaxID=41844 RepID=A0ABD1XMR2_9MARC
MGISVQDDRVDAENGSAHAQSKTVKSKIVGVCRDNETPLPAGVSTIVCNQQHVEYSAKTLDFPTESESITREKGNQTANQTENSITRDFKLGTGRDDPAQPLDKQPEAPHN